MPAGLNHIYTSDALQLPQAIGSVPALGQHLCIHSGNCKSISTLDNRVSACIHRFCLDGSIRVGLAAAGYMEVDWFEYPQTNGSLPFWLCGPAQCTGQPARPSVRCDNNVQCRTLLHTLSLSAQPPALLVTANGDCQVPKLSLMPLTRMQLDRSE